MGLETLPKSGRLLRFELPQTRPGAPVSGRLRVLVVDDNRAHREILHRYLDHWGVRSESAADGSTALTALRRAAEAGEPFDLAILDLAMPGMDGFALAEAVRQDHALDDTQLILLTAFDQRGQARAALDQGFAAYLTKPVRHSRLLDTVQRVLRAAPRGPAPLSDPPPSRQDARA
jgi:CheY-like chemotaxis protein